MTSNKAMSDQELDDLFADAAANPPLVSDNLLERVMADAERVMVEPRAENETQALLRVGFFGNFAAAIGGWPGIAGLATATIAGVWLGFAPPPSVDELTNIYLAQNSDYDLGGLMPSINDLLYEG